MYITEKRLLKWGLYCNSIYILFLFLFSPDGINFLNITITSILVLSAIMIFTVCFKNFKYLENLPKNTRTLFYLIIFWGFIVVIRSFSLSVQDWATNFGNIYTALAWVLPLVLILGLKIENWRVVFKAISFMFSLMLIAFIVYPFFPYNEEWILLLRPVNFLLLIGLSFFGFFKRLKIYLIIILYLVSVIYISSRRVDQLFFLITILFLVMDKLLSIQIKKFLVKYLILAFILVLILIFTIGYEHISKLVAKIVEFQDSRTFLFAELMRDLNFTEKIVGRGSLGTYYSDYMEHTKWYTEVVLKKEWWGDSSTRITIEVGYLQMILKGGVILLILNLIIFIRSSYVAIFKSKNKFIKRLGYFILILSFLSLIEFRPTFTPLFFILWMAIGTVWKKAYREMEDQEINALINFR